MGRDVTEQGKDEDAVLGWEDGSTTVDFIADTSIFEEDETTGEAVILGPPGPLVPYAASEQAHIGSVAPQLIYVDQETQDRVVPAAVPPGAYYVGWLTQAAEEEYSTVNNSAVVADRLLRVDVAFTPTPTSTRTPEPTSTETATAPPASTGTPGALAACLGDCDGDRSVGVDELVRVIAVGLGMAPVAQCPSADADADGQVSITEMIAAVGNALDGCRS